VPVTATTDKRVLFFSRAEGSFSRVRDALVGAGAWSPDTGVVTAGDDSPGSPSAWRASWHLRASVEALLDDLRDHYVNLIVLDLRGPDGASVSEELADAFAVLDALDRAEDLEGRYAFDRILALLPAHGCDDVDALLLRLGARGVGHVLRLDVGSGEDRVARAILETVGRLLRPRARGRRALCAAGGGITGIYFELGALKCLDDCLGGEGVNGFDMYFGISAGAVVTAPLAVGYSIDEIMAAVASEPGGRIPRLDLRLFRFGHVDGPGFARRAALAARTAGVGLRSLFTGRRTTLEDPLLLDYADLVAAPFRADRFEATLRQILTTPGATNDFRALPRPLYIGATDQDARAHVVFGDERHDHVPISRAVQASLSINPAFSATRIGGRFYEDGAVTRTSNFVEAIRRGATLVVVIDPFVPYVARRPGFADRRGMLYNIDQDIRTISYTRFETTRGWVQRQHPEVSTYAFVPANRVRRVMSVNPMNHRPYLEIWRGAYLSVYNRLRAVEHRFGGDVLAHGVPFDLTRAAEVAARLDATPRPELADFFPDRRVVLRQPPLVLAGQDT